MRFGLRDELAEAPLIAQKVREIVPDDFGRRRAAEHVGQRLVGRHDAAAASDLEHAGDGAFEEQLVALL